MMERKAMTTAEWIAYKKREIQRNKDIHCPYVAQGTKGNWKIL